MKQLKIMRASPGIFCTLLVCLGGITRPSVASTGVGAHSLLLVDYVKHETWVGDPYGAGVWQTDWIDHFEGRKLNRSYWNVLVGAQAEFNNEQQWYVDEEADQDNFWINNSVLYIQLQREQRNFAGRVKNFSSARLSSKGKIDRVGGAWEARLTFIAGGGVRGAWPAFWILGSAANEEPQPGPACWPTHGAREIDIFEYAINPKTMGFDRMMTNFIRGNSCGQPHHEAAEHPINPYEWHTYRLEFYGGFVKIFIDGQFIRQTTWDAFTNQKFHAILNVAVGGAFGGEISWP